MPRKTNTAAADKAALPRIPAELLEQLIPGPVTPGQFEDIFQHFKKAFIERALGAELSQHLGYAPGQVKPDGATNHRNGKSTKKVLTDTGALASASAKLNELHVVQWRHDVGQVRTAQVSDAHHAVQLKIGAFLDAQFTLLPGAIALVLGRRRLSVRARATSHCTG